MRPVNPHIATPLPSGTRPRNQGGGSGSIKTAPVSEERNYLIDDAARSAARAPPQGEPVGEAAVTRTGAFPRARAAAGIPLPNPCLSAEYGEIRRTVVVNFSPGSCQRETGIRVAAEGTK